MQRSEMNPEAENYYSYHPIVDLAEPIIVIGSPQARPGMVVATIGCLTGLTVIELDRWVEHFVGCSVKKILESRGSASLHRERINLLERAVLNRPPALIAVDERFALKAGPGVLLDLPVKVLWLRDQSRSLRQGAGLCNAVENAIFTFIQWFRSVRVRVFRGRNVAATAILQIDGQHPWTIAQEVVRQLKSK